MGVFEFVAEEVAVVNVILAGDGALPKLRVWVGVQWLSSQLVSGGSVLLLRNNKNTRTFIAEKKAGMRHKGSRLAPPDCVESEEPAIL